MKLKDKVDNHPVIVTLGVIALVIGIVAGSIAIYEFAEKRIPVDAAEITTVEETTPEATSQSTIAETTTEEETTTETPETTKERTTTNPSTEGNLGGAIAEWIDRVRGSGQ